MPERITKTQRWLDLIAYLVPRRRPVTVEELMEGVPAYAAKASSGDERDFAAVRRMFERDKDELRGLGVPLETVEYTIEFGSQQQEGYRLQHRDFYLPYLKVIGREASRGRRRPGIADVELRAEEAGLAVDALRRAAALPALPFAADARSALRKLGFDFDLADFPEAPVVFADATREPHALVARLSDAIAACKRVHFVYHGIARDEATQRDVAGYALLCRYGRWYLIGHDALRDDVRVFRIDRMDGVTVNTAAPRTPDYDVPADFDVAHYTSAHPWELGAGDAPPMHVDVRFDFPASLWAARNAHGTLVRELDGGAAIRRFDVADADPFLRWVLGFAGDARVVAPADQRRAFVELARAVAALYDDEANA